MDKFVLPACHVKLAVGAVGVIESELLLQPNNKKENAKTDKNKFLIIIIFFALFLLLRLSVAGFNKVQPDFKF